MPARRIAFIGLSSRASVQPSASLPAIDASISSRARVGARHDIVEEIDLGLGIFDVLDGRAEPVVVEFVEQVRERSPLHLVLIERLHRGEPRGGAGLERGGWWP